MSRFVLSICDQDPTKFGYLETFVKGHMLANVLYLPEGLSEVGRRFGKTAFYLDTPVVLRAVGYANRTIARPSQELLELLRGYNASLRIFEHTQREIEGVLDSAALGLRKGRKTAFEGSVYEHFVTEGLSSADAERMIAALPERLKNARIDVVEAPPQTEPLAVDETRLQELLAQQVTYPRDEAMYRDIDSLTAIHRLRGGRYHARLESCPAIFVTSNMALVRASRKFFREVYERQVIPVAVPDHALTTIAWLKDPLQASSLPRDQMIADSYAALNPSDALWQRYVDEIVRLEHQGDISEQEFVLLRFSMDARHELMDLTLGDEAVFTEGTVQQVLAHARNAAAGEASTTARLATEQRQLERLRHVASVAARWVARGVMVIATLA